ncbi:MAG: AraC family transcriptional regulator [Acidobacteria bacterium]|nr:AraC family transcriptional regulator [Acidobacteriota bacterium]
MTRNLNRNVSLAEMAKAIHLSPSHLRQLFKRETGVPIARYRRRLRLAEARRLLRNTFLNVKEVAATVGVTGVSHFVRDFEKAYGTTPGRYAARYRKASQAKRTARETLNRLTNRQF